MPDPVIEIVGENKPPSGFSESSSSIDFGALRARASAMMEDAVADPEPVVVAIPDPPVRVKGATTSGQVPAAVKLVDPVEPVKEPAADADVAAKEALDLADDTLVKVLVDGEEQILPWKDARGKISGGMKFTKNMQTLAKERDEFAGQRSTLTQLQTERQQLEAFLADESRVRQYLSLKFPTQGVVPAPAETGDPNEIATVGQAREIAAQLQKSQETAFTKAIEERIAAATNEIDFKTQQSKHAVVIQSTLTDLFTKHPVLNAIPDAEDIIRYNVAKMKPTTEAEALDAFRTVAQGMVDDIGKHFKADKKIQAVAAVKAKLESKTIEPAAGAAPQIQPTNFKDANGQVNWKLVKAAASEYLG